jgi:predicted O-methyltransferase YrrM
LRARLKRAGVRGFCYLGQGLTLFWLSRFLPREGVVVEVGSAYGLSTIVLARGGSRRVVTVDTHEGQGMSAPEDSFDEFRANIARFEVERFVEAHRSTSAELAQTFSGEAQLVYVDGLHTVEGVRSDIDVWLPHLRRGGVAVFDDYVDPEWGVREAVDKAAAAGRLELVGVVFGQAVARPAQSAASVVA